MLGFFANMMFVVSARTALVYMPVMLGLFAILYLGRRATVLLLVGAVAAAALVWFTSPYLRDRIEAVAVEYQSYQANNAASSTGLRLEYWRKSLGFFAKAPILGNGTGSTKQLFERDAIGQSGASADIIGNPHNQTLNVAVQWGLLGCVLLYAMWFCHLLLFNGMSLSSWIGLLVVVQNIVSSLLNSHLFDFHEGWMYVLGVGVAGGTVLKKQSWTSERQVGKSAEAHDSWHAARKIELSAGGKLSSPIFLPLVNENDASFQLTSAQFSDRVHDALATAIALLGELFICASRVASCFMIAFRFCCTFFLISSRLASSVCYVFNLTTTKWRFISLPDALNILRAATVLALALLVLDYIFVRGRTVTYAFFLGKVTIVLYWFLEVFFLSALALCLSLFPLYARTPSCTDRGRVAGPTDRPRRGRRNSAARN